VGDALPVIEGALREASARVPGGVVVVTGGLGPTLDDRTRDAVAAHFRVPLELDPEILRALEARALARGLPGLAETNRRIALVPNGATKLPNPVGTAPGLELPLGAGVLAVLPGVPREMQAIFDAHLAPRLSLHFEGVVEPMAQFRVMTAGIVESQLAQELEAVVSEVDGIHIAYRPSLEGVEVRISVDPSEVPAGVLASVLLENAVQRALPILAPWRVDGGEEGAFAGAPANGSELAGALLRALHTRGLRVATAESCTGGRVAQKLTSVPGSSRTVLGGVVAYANSVKVEGLGVDPALIEAHGAVSEPVAAAMAEGASRLTGAEVAVGITGIAGPSGGTPEKPVGTVCFGYRLPDGSVVTERKFLPGGRDEIRIRATAHALFRLLRLVGSDGNGAPGAPGSTPSTLPRGGV
jgi:nicotinamide-nucleotide amidase